MGITIHYRGRLADLTRIEDFEDRVLDFTLEIGGLAKIWRTYDEQRPERMIRGLIVNLAPGQDSMSLLISPEGWLIGLIDIESAERGEVTEPPWCFVKTQFGPIEGHVAVVEMLRALKQQFFPDLEVVDEGGYWETSNFAELARRHQFLGKAIEGLAEGLRQHGLSSEAAEDPNILMRHIERVAEQVQRTLRRPSEHPPIEFPEDSDIVPPDPAANEQLWDEMYKHNRRQQERINRSIEERRSAGQDHDEAFEDALRDELALDLPGDDEDDDETGELDTELDFVDAGAEEDGAPPEDVLATRERARHPLLETATDLTVRMHKTFRGTEPRFTTALQTLFDGAGDAVGGLAQALSDYGDNDDVDAILARRGLQIAQLKRALRGAAFAHGALFHLRPAADEATVRELIHAYDDLQRGILDELGRVRES
jgi:hypothetical protein